MPVLENGDFSNGLTGWTSIGVGPTAPTFDPANGWVVFGQGNGNDVRDGDRLQQEVSLEQGTEYTLTFAMSEFGSGVGGFGLNIDLIELNPDGSQGNSTSLGFEQVVDEETNNVSITFTSPYDDAILQFRGGFGFGGINSALVLDDIALTCFGLGTLIMTPQGEKAIETLKVGDLVNTLDSGPCRVRWIGRRKLTSQVLQRNPKLRPIRIAASALRSGLPQRDLFVSRQHRMLVSSRVTERMFGSDSALVAAIKLTELPGIDVDDSEAEVEYLHLLFDKHEVIFAEGAPSESLYTGPEALKAVPQEARDEILTLFPELSEGHHMPEPAQLIPQNGQQRQLVTRLAKNQKLPLESYECSFVT